MTGSASRRSLGSDVCKAAPEHPILPPTEGYKRATRVPEGGARAALAHLQEPWHTETSVLLEGKWYQARVESHCDDHVGNVLKWHKGVSLFEPTDGRGEDLGTRLLYKEPPPRPRPRPSAPGTLPGPQDDEPTEVPSVSLWGPAVVATLLAGVAAVALLHQPRRPARA